MLLYMAARAQLVEQVIRPALAAGKTVVCDRFLLANVVYQGYAGGLDVDALWSVGEVATGGLHPDLTIVLDMDVRAARERMDRALDRMESQGTEFLERVRHGFLIESRLQHEQHRRRRCGARHRSRTTGHSIGRGPAAESVGVGMVLPKIVGHEHVFETFRRALAATATGQHVSCSSARPASASGRPR